MDDRLQSLYERTTRKEIEEWLEEIEQALELGDFEPTEQEVEQVEAVLSHLAAVAVERPLTPRALGVLRRIRDRAISSSIT